MARARKYPEELLERGALILRELVGDELFCAVAELVESTQPRFAAIAELRAALPQHEFLASRRLRGAAADSEKGSSSLASWSETGESSRRRQGIAYSR